MNRFSTVIFEPQKTFIGTNEYNDLLKSHYETKARLFGSNTMYFALSLIKKLSFLERWCFKYLSKRGVLMNDTYALGEAFEVYSNKLTRFYREHCYKTDYARIDMDLTDINQMLSKIIQIVNDKRARYNYDITTVLVGRNEYSFLMPEGNLVKPMQLSHHQGMIVCGFRVILIPWMDGIVPIPDFSKDLL